MLKDHKFITCTKVFLDRVFVPTFTFVLTLIIALLGWIDQLLDSKIFDSLSENSLSVVNEAIYVLFLTSIFGVLTLIKKFYYYSKQPASQVNVELINHKYFKANSIELKKNDLIKNSPICLFDATISISSVGKNIFNSNRYETFISEMKQKNHDVCVLIKPGQHRSFYRIVQDPKVTMQSPTNDAGRTCIKHRGVLFSITESLLDVHRDNSNFRISHNISLMSNYSEEEFPSLRSEVMLRNELVVCDQKDHNSCSSTCELKKNVKLLFDNNQIIVYNGK